MKVIETPEFERLMGAQVVMRRMAVGQRKPPLRRVITLARRFVLVRHRDVTGTSGVGIVADGVEFSNGKAVLAWRTSHTSVAVYESLKVLEAVHCHRDGDRPESKALTEVVFLDDQALPIPGTD